MAQREVLARGQAGGCEVRVEQQDGRRVVVIDCEPGMLRGATHIELAYANGPADELQVASFVLLFTRPGWMWPPQGNRFRLRRGEEQMMELPLDFIRTVEAGGIRVQSVHAELVAPVPGVYVITLRALRCEWRDKKELYCDVVHEVSLPISTIATGNLIATWYINEVILKKPAAYAAPGEPLLVSAEFIGRGERGFIGFCYVDGPADSITLQSPNAASLYPLLPTWPVVPPWDIIKRPVCEPPQRELQVVPPLPEEVVPPIELRRGQCVGSYSSDTLAVHAHCMSFPAEGTYIVQVVTARAKRPIGSVVRMTQLEVVDVRSISVDVSYAGSYKLVLRAEGPEIVIPPVRIRGGAAYICIDSPHCSRYEYMTYAIRVTYSAETPYFRARNSISVYFHAWEWVRRGVWGLPRMDTKLHVEVVDTSGNVVGRCTVAHGQTCTIRVPQPSPVQPSPVQPSPVYPSPIYPSPTYPSPIYPSPSPRALPRAPGVPSWVVPAVAGAGAFVIGAVAGTMILRRLHAA
jgi:hypothetical protein